MTRFDWRNSASSPDNGNQSLTPLEPQFSQSVKFIKWLINFKLWLFGIIQKFSTQFDIRIGGSEENLKLRFEKLLFVFHELKFFFFMEITGLSFFKSSGIERRLSASGWSIKIFPDIFSKILFKVVVDDSMFFLIKSLSIPTKSGDKLIEVTRYGFPCK